MHPAPEFLVTEKTYSDTPSCRTMRRAAEDTGGIERLAQCIGCDAADLQHWYAGESLPPMMMFFKALDIVAHTPAVRVCVLRERRILEGTPESRGPSL